MSQPEQDGQTRVTQKIEAVSGTGAGVVGAVNAATGSTVNVGGRHTYVEARKSDYLYAGVPGMVRRFLGRDDLVHELVETLTGGGAGAVAAHGLPGVGKTSLAVALAHHEQLLDHSLQLCSRCVRSQTGPFRPGSGHGRRRRRDAGAAGGAQPAGAGR